MKAKFLHNNFNVLDLKCTLFTRHPVRRVHFALYD